MVLLKCQVVGMYVTSKTKMTLIDVLMTLQLTTHDKALGVHVRSLSHVFLHAVEERFQRMNDF